MPVEKFLFETTFESDEAYAAESAVETRAQEAPAFSQEDLDAARGEGFSAGREEGLLKAAETAEQHTATAMNTIKERLEEVLSTQVEANTHALKASTTLAIAITRKMYPHLEERFGLDEIEHLVESTLARLVDEPRVFVRVNMDMYEILSPKLDAVSTSLGYEGQIVLIPDDAMEMGTCQVGWTDGTARRDPVSMWEEIDEIVERNLGPEAVDWTHPPEVEKEAPEPADEDETEREEIDPTGDLFEWDTSADPNRVEDDAHEARDDS